ncbi:proline racemase family protein, partial [Mesorhizobium qingshengii]|uniref:proline racemase family protein n=1 Tax=Mesorhizobium qingshengii TaxID=1165689 RepID=UPI0022B9677A
MIEVAGAGTIRVDIAYGGMTYAMVEAADLGFAIEPNEARDLCAMGRRVKSAAAEQLPVAYPGNPDMPGITNSSPCGTGSSARLALMHARGELGAGESFIHESITGSRFTCAIDGLASW